jgi:UDPglucose 6-dehydrogenase
VRAFDPVATAEARRIYGERPDLVITKSAAEALEDADALVIVTEWSQFRSPDFELIRSKLKHPALFDGRNMFDPGIVTRFGLSYFSIGRPAAHP